jgi:hypothetical protein
MKLDEHGPYGLVRHPIYLGWIFMVWPAPVMNGTRLAFAAISTVYLIVAIPFEERDLGRTFGPAYRHYSGPSQIQGSALGLLGGSVASSTFMTVPRSRPG